MFRKTLSVLLAVLLLCAAVPMGAVQAAAAEGSLSAEGDYPKLTPGTPFEVNITAGGEKAILAFTAAETGTYTFASSGDGDTIGVLYDSDMNEIASDDDSGEGAGTGDMAEEAAAALSCALVAKRSLRGLVRSRRLVTLKASALKPVAMTVMRTVSPMDSSTIWP